MEIHPRVLFNEPRGRRTGMIFLSLSLICFLGYVYFGILLDGPHFLLVLGVMIALSGFAESLPTDRRRVAGALRLVAVGLGIGMLALLAFAPEILLR